MNRHHPVTIVGAGPCGLMTALLLARQGIRCRVFEKNSSLSDHPKAMGISRRTAEIYRSSGLMERLVSSSLDLSGLDLQIWCRRLIGAELGRTPIADLHSPLSPCSPMHCPQTAIERILLDALLAEPAAEVKFGVEVSNVFLGDSGGEVEMACGARSTFDWLIAADGASSNIRKRLGIRTSGPGDMGHFLNIMFRSPLDARLIGRRAVMYCAVWETGFETFVRVDDHNIWLMHHFLQPGESPADFSGHRLAAMIRDASGIPDLPVEILRVTPWVMSPKIAENFACGRCLLVGDSASRLSPSGGLGLNNGIQSAHNLAWKLAAVLRGEADETLLTSYNQERRNFAMAAMRHSNQTAGEIFAIVAEAAGERWEAAAELVRGSRRAGSGMGLDLGFAYKTGAFIPDGPNPPEPDDPVNQFLPDASPGRRAPHANASLNDSPISLLDLFDSRFVLLVARGGTSWKAAASTVRVLQNSVDFECEGFETLYGIGERGAVLVRPDGIVSARWRVEVPSPEITIQAALRRILRPLLE